MSVAVKYPPVQAQSRSPELYRLSIQQYHRMIEMGILTDKDRVELLNGWLVEKMPHNPPHDAAIMALQQPLWAHLPPDWKLRIQSAVTLDNSELEPDLAIVRGPLQIYFKRHPVPKDIGLLIEVADTTLEDDLRFKGPEYARNRIPVYWIINLVDRKVEVYTQPRAGRSPGYRGNRVYGVEDAVPLVIEGSQISQISVRDLMP